MERSRRWFLVKGSQRSPVYSAATVTFILAILLMGRSAAHASPIISVSSTGANIDDIIDWVSVDVRIDAVLNLHGYQFGLAFDPSILEVFQVVEGDFLSSTGPTLFFPGFVDNVGGLINFHQNVLITPNTGANGSGVLLRVLFFVRRPGTSLVSVILDPLRGDVLVDSRFRPIAPVVTEAGTVTIEPSRRVPEPTIAMLGTMAVVAMRIRRRRRRQQADR
jgi:hypothetical protein